MPLTRRGCAWRCGASEEPIRKATTRYPSDMSDKDLSVGQVTIDEIPALVKTMTNAFIDEPLVSWVVKEREERRAFVAELFRLTIHQYLPCGHVFATRDLRAAVIALPPATPVPPGDQAGFAALASSLDDEARVRLSMINRLLSDARPVRDHYYFAFAGVHPDRSRAGIGSMLVNHCLSTPEARGQYAYAEAGNESGRRLMVRCGFRVITETRLPGLPTAISFLEKPA